MTEAGVSGCVFDTLYVWCLQGGDGLPRRASVKAIYTLDDKECRELGLADGTPELEFSRIIGSDGTTSYRIGREQVKHDAYIVTLGKLRLNIAARNFLVFQVGGRGVSL